MSERINADRRSTRVVGVVALIGTQAALGQSSPFDTGANALVAWGLTIATPIAVIVIIIAGGAAAFGKISWGWFFGAFIGIGAIFGSEQIVTWIRGLFGV